MHRLRQYFVTGLLVWLPAAITAWVLLWLMGILNGIFLSVLSALEAVIPGMVTVGGQLRRVPGLGVILVTVIIFGTGVFVANMVGQWWLRRWDALMTRIPVVRTLYSSVKQVSDTILSPHGQAFRKALLVEYPRRGCWTLGFLTGAPSAAMQAKMGVSSGQEEDTMVSVFVPTTPNPTSGFFLMMRREETVELDMSVDAALKYIVSMGVVAPPVGRNEAETNHE